MTGHTVVIRDHTVAGLDERYQDWYQDADAAVADVIDARVGDRPHLRQGAEYARETVNAAGILPFIGARLVQPGFDTMRTLEVPVDDFKDVMEDYDGMDAEYIDTLLETNQGLQIDRPTDYVYNIEVDGEDVTDEIYDDQRILYFGSPGPMRAIVDDAVESVELADDDYEQLWAYSETSGMTKVADRLKSATCLSRFHL